ncbi:MAG: thioredoxin family protein [Sedimentisphaerales bacterium]|nr:thioredoxin family protein [Sedimentisphaerales bacterium]
MTATASTMPALGTKAPDFQLPDTEGKMVKLSDFDDSLTLLVIFMCNHCPFVKHIIDPLVELVRQYQKKGVAVVGINSNDIKNYPDDSPELMAALAKEKRFTFPYLYDQTQQVAKTYKAACTPDFFLFDADRKLFYRGQMDDSRPGNDIPITGEDLTDALEVLLAGKKPPQLQKPSMGCNIKWKKGNEPDYF